MSEDEKLLKDAKKLPWDERLAHKNWKVRNDANIDLAAVCDGIMDPKDPRLRDFGPLFKKAVSDSNAPVQEKALDALIAFLRAADADSSRFGKEICDAIVAKCLTGRPKTVEKAQACFLLWIELEACEAFLDCMEKAIKNKVAKAVVPAIDVMFQAVSEFGTKVVPPKRILKMLPELFDHQDQNVRASAKGLTIELCRWIGKEPVKSILFEKMRDTMKKEIEGEMSEITGVPKPTRRIRSEQLKEIEQDVVAEIAGTVTTDEASGPGPVEIDEYDLVDPVDILAPLEKSSFWEGVKATKWSERRDAVGELTKLASAKKISPGDFGEVCRTLKKLITDVNIAVAVEAVQATGNLAKGLRKDFTSGARLLLPTLLEKLKEKKPVMAEALTQTLQALHSGGSIQLIDVVEDVKAATKNKVPSVRSITLTWITTCIESSQKAVVLKLHKDYIPILMESLNDGTPEVRDAAFAALAAIAKMVGMRPLERSLEKLDEVRKKKLTEMIGTSGNGPVTAPAAVPTRASASSNINSTSESEGASAKRSAASMLSGKKPSQTALPTTKKSGGTTKKAEGAGSHAKAGAADSAEDVEPSEMSLEEIEARVGALFPGEVITNLKSSVWKERLEAMVTVKEVVEGLTEIDKNTEILIRLLSVLPGWSEKNVQVQQKVIEVVADLAERSSTFSKRCVVICINGVAERVSDIKTRAQAIKCLTALCEAVGPGFVFDRMFKIMKEHKNPKVLSEGLLWMVAAVEDFGISHLKLKDIIDFAKDVGLQSSVPASRTSAIKLLGVLHKFVGPDLKAFVSDVKPALQSALDAEYDKNPYEGPVTVKRTVRSADVDESAGSGGGDGLPREDISSKLTPTLIKNMGSPDWKLRQESIDSVNKIIEEANKRIQPTGTGELFGSLKSRLCDSNKNLVMMTLATLGNVASAMGPAVDKSSKGILTDILKCLGDNKKQMRETVIKTLDVWIAVLQLEKMSPYIVPAVVDNKICADGRKELIEWVTRQMAKVTEHAELVQLIKPMALSLQDKSSEVRKAAEICLVDLIKACGHDQATKSVRDLQGSALAAVQPILDRQRSSDFVDTVTTSKSSIPKPGVSKAGKSGSNTSGNRPSSRSGPVSSRAAVGKGVPGQTKQALAVAAQDAAVQGQALFNLKDSNKEDREKSVSRKLKFEEPRPEQVQDIEADLMKYFREDLHRRLLSPDFKKQVDGLELLQKSMPAHTKEMIELADVIFKWSVLRFCESNTTCLLKVLEFLPDFVEVMKTEGYTLTEYEACILLPCLVEKSGHNIEKVREKMRELMRLICCIYPSSKLFVYIVEGLKSKNNRTRIESVDHLGYLIDRYGIEIAGPTKALQAISVLTSERDSEIRKSALQTLSVAYKILGDDIWRHVGKLSDAQKSMLDDKFKWKAREMEKRKEGRPGEERAAALRLSVRDNGLVATEQSGETISRPGAPTAVQSIVRSHNGHHEAAFEQSVLASNLVASTAGPSDWNEALDIIESGATPEHAVEGMKLVCHELNQAASDTEGASLDEIAKDADRLVLSLTKKVATTFHLGLAGASSRSCKYVLNTLMQTFQLKKLAHNVSQETLNKLIMELLLWLLDERVPLMDDGSQLLKALNVLMLKILENADRTSAFVVLIQLLRPLDLSRFPGPKSEESALIRGQKFSDLVVKCLIKLTKVLGATIFEVDLDRLLQSIHEYLQDLGMEEIRRRAGADDKPLRMVKTVLHELVKLRGTSIKGHLSMVPIDLEPQPIILAYIDLNLQTLAAARMLTPSGTITHGHWSDSSQNGVSSPVPHSNEAQLKQELAAIFKKIGDKQTCTIGLFELYRITQLYPQVDIFAQLQNASEAFRTYIRDGLAQMEKNAAAGRTPTNFPVVTPPPVSSPSHTSPKVAPPSPLNTRLPTMRLENSINQLEVDHPHGAASPPKVMDFKKEYHSRMYAVAQDALSNIQEGKMNYGMPGTLDAIRERMKNIQAAASGKLPTASAAGQYANGNVGLSHSTNMRSTEINTSDSTTQPVETHIPLEDKALSGLQARMERLKSGVLGNFV